MKNTLAIVVVFALSLMMPAQSRHSRSKRSQTRSSTAPLRTDLNSSLLDLDRAAMDTHSDISGMRPEKWGQPNWKPGFLEGARQKQMQQTAASLKHNLSGALPMLMANVRDSRGSVASTFKLYHDLTLVCEALDTLSAAAQARGRREEYRTLADDDAAMSRIRHNLYIYIEQRASVLDARAAAQTYTSTQAENESPRRRPVKKIVISDFNEPAPPPARRTTAISSARMPAAVPANSFAAVAVSQPAEAPEPKKIIIDDTHDPPANGPSNTAAAETAQPATAQLPKKIIIDDTVPEKKPMKKKAVIQYSNL